MAGRLADRSAPRRAARVTEPWPFGVALALAVILHLALLLGVSFDLPTPHPQGARALEVLVLRQPAPIDRPELASALAQADRRGEQGHDEAIVQAEREDEIPLPSPTVEEDATPLDVELASPETAEPAPAEPVPPEPEQEASSKPDLLAAKPPAAIDVAQILDSRQAEIARLNAQVLERATAYTHQPRRKAISASTREYKYANYLEAWRRKVERIGNLNYPEVAKERKLYGSLILLVSVRADGQVENIRVLRSSGYTELDQAAVRIVELAAPFAPFPPDIRAATDILDITRTWQFLHGNRLGWEH